MAGRECYHCKQHIEDGEAHDCWTTTEAALTRDLSEDLQDAWERLRETAADFGDQFVEIPVVTESRVDPIVIGGVVAVRAGSEYRTERDTGGAEFEAPQVFEHGLLTIQAGLHDDVAELFFGD